MPLFAPQSQEGKQKAPERRGSLLAPGGRIRVPSSYSLSTGEKPASYRPIVKLCERPSVPVNNSVSAPP